MRRSEVVLALFVGALWPRASEAAEPPSIAVPTALDEQGPPPPPPPPPPRHDGTGMVVLGSVSMLLGTGGLVTTPFWGHGPWSLISGLLGAGGLICGSVSMYFGVRQQLALRNWQANSGMSPRAWRRRYEPGRPHTGAGLLGFGSLSLGLGAALAGVGFVDAPLFAGFEPGDNPSSILFATGGTVGLVAGTTMIVMGAIQHRHHRRWTPPDDDLDELLVLVPWASPSGAGLGLAGRF